MLPQLLPFQCFTKVFVPAGVVSSPTAKQLVTLGHATPARVVASAPVRLGFGASDQVGLALPAGAAPSSTTKQPIATAKRREAGRCIATRNGSAAATRLRATRELP